MKKMLILAALFAILLPVILEAGQVRGYTRRDGTYVQPYQRTNPDGNPYNNYNFPGNYNPNTGQTTPGNPDTYLDRYYNRRDSSPSPRGNSPSLENPYNYDPLKPYGGR